MLSLKGVIDNNNGDEEDVLELKQNLQQLGYYKTPKYGMTGYTDDETFEGVKRFQKDNNLTVDGVLKPGGETESKLNEHLSRRKSFDSPQTAPSTATGTENDDSINRLHEKYKNTLVRRNLLTTNNMYSAKRRSMQENFNKKDFIKNTVFKAKEIYEKSNVKNPISTENKVLDFVIGKIPLVKEWNKGFNAGKALFIAKQTYDEMTKSKE